MTVSLSGAAFVRPDGATTTLAGFIGARAEQHPDVRYVEVDRAGKRVSATVGELHRRALRILSILRDHVAPGKSDLVLCFESALDFIPAAWACIHGGYSCLPWHLTGGHGQDIRARLDAIGGRLIGPVLVTTEAIAERIVGSEGSPFRAVIAIDLDSPTTLPPEAVAALLADPAAGEFLIPTSGTTAATRFAIVTNRCLLNRHLALHEALSHRARVHCFPFEGTAGLLILFPAAADRIYLQPGRLAAQPLELLKLVEEFRLEGIGVSSSVLARILDASEGLLAHPDLSSLKHVAFGSEMIVPNLVRRLGDRLREMGVPDLKVWFGYGMTETGGICWTERIGIDRALERLEGSDPVSVGPCVAGWSLRIVDDAGRALPAGTPGNIEVWSDTQLFSGYRNDPELTGASFAEDGWFRTGDIGFVRDGALTLVGRQKATIAVNARKISLESIEAPLRGMPGIRLSLVAAAAVRQHNSATDELAVFFVPDDDGKAAIDALGRQIVHEVGQHSGLPVRHLVAIAEGEVPLTATGKIRREELVRLYNAGALAPHAPGRDDRPSTADRLTDTERWLAELWQKVLRLDFLPSPADSLFDLGGDSLASAELIFSVEEKFACELPVERFFRNPTIATLAGLIGREDPASPARPRAPPAGGGYRLLHKIQSFTGSWPGERLFPDGLVVGLNRGGSRTPIFWVFQDRGEFQQLASYLGPDQPLFGMRSCVGIVGVKDYSTDVIETVCNRYLWEMLAFGAKAPFYVGGNCQAGIFALALAKRLRQIGRAPSLLFLIEWGYSFGPYPEPTLLLYGDRDPRAVADRQAGRLDLKWRHIFPDSSVASIPGLHGQYFTDENVGGLADAIRRYVRRRSLWSRFNRLIRGRVPER